MNKRGQLYTALCMLSIATQYAYCMSGKDNPFITHNGVEKKLIGHIVKSQLCKTYPFSVTRVLKKTNNGEFEDQGDIISLQREQVDDYIKEGNWIYLAVYKETTTRLHKDTQQIVGAVILGTTDPNNIKTLLK